MIQGEMKMGEKIIKEAKPKKVPDLHPELKKFIDCLLYTSDAADDCWSV